MGPTNVCVCVMFRKGDQIVGRICINLAFSHYDFLKDEVAQINGNFLFKQIYYIFT